jgi:predicted TIM-barrel fold metal-dependent hydrolase
MIDCDLHNVVPNVEALLPYLPAYWRETVRQTGFKGPIDTAYHPKAALTARPDTVPISGAPAGSDLATLRAQALDAAGAEFGILNCAYAIESIHNPYAAEAFATAVNEWQIEHWLEPEPRLRAALVVPSHFPDLAVKEIERRGDYRGFAQIFLPAHSASPYGNRRYFPVYEAAIKHNLVIGIHFGGAPGNPPTASGWFSYYIEDYANMATIFQSQVLSLVSEGVFEQFPTLRVALIEGGFTWMPSLMWRLDKEWKGLRRETPWVKQLPSDYIRQHMRLTTQPLDAPPQPEQLLEVMQQLDSDEMLMYASDYPHWHQDANEPAFPIELPEPLQTKIMAENARAFYQLT